MKVKLNRDALELARMISHQVWEKYDDTYGYRSEKQKRNAEVSSDNPDNIWFFWQQFDVDNQIEFLVRLCHEDSSAKVMLLEWIVEAEQY